MPNLRNGIYAHSFLYIAVTLLTLGASLFPASLVAETINIEPASRHPNIDYLTMDDGIRLRWALWPPSPPVRGTVVLLNGRAEFIEKYQEQAEDWSKRGYQTFSLDWRGQGLSDRELSNRQKSHIDNYTRYVADLDQFLKKIVFQTSKDNRRVLFAHSMGSLIALHYLLKNPDAFQAIILSSPMIDIITDPWPRWAAEMMARYAIAFGFATSYAFSQDDYDPTTNAQFIDNVLTSDPTRFAQHHQMLRANSNLRLGGVTFGWLVASFRAGALLTFADRLNRITSPILMISSPDDRLTPADAHESLCRRLQHCTYKAYSGGRHELMRETDVIRARVWEDIDGFLDWAQDSSRRQWK
ncbi:lysophospholipase [Azospirillaceae bacterium]